MEDNIQPENNINPSLKSNMNEASISETPSSTTSTNRVNLSHLQDKIDRLQASISQVIVGQEEILDLILVGLLSNGHLLIEGMPGVAKTLMAKCVAKLIDVDYNRIQFTPDLMPSDVLGTSIFNPGSSTFNFNKGPIFSNIVLIDEINRAPAKTQSALFEVMEERQITMDSVTYKLTDPFIILATQNPVEHEGTYRLPEAQLDRFLFKVKVDYPTLDNEVQILKNHSIGKGSFAVNELKPVLTAAELAQMKSTVQSIHVSDDILQFIAKIVGATRNSSSIYLGASPRASIALLTASKALATINNRDFVIPEDVVYLVPHVLRHRIVLMPEKEMDGATEDTVIQELLAGIQVPR